MLREGDEGYIYYISSLEVKCKANVEEPLVDCEYPDVFREELPGLPPKREVEFHLDLVPKMTLISKTQYRFAHAELAKPKK